MPSLSHALPPDFVWGCATSAYQIEGATETDGRGEGIWDRFTRKPGAVRNGEHAQLACDHYHRYAEDLDLAKALGLAAYRFSVSWPRILPHGAGAPNAAGLAYYDRLIEAMLARDLEPWLTAYHWDLPQALEERGGWRSREVADAFADFVALLVDRYGDRVKRWIVLNEPTMSSYRGHAVGIDAPGIRDVRAFYASIHHLNLAQGRAIAAMRARRSDLSIGTSLLLAPTLRSTASHADSSAAELLDAVWNRAFLDPLLKGSYPPVLHDRLAPFVQGNDLDDCNQVLDFLGVNYYSPNHAAADPSAPLGFVRLGAPDGSRVSPCGMAIDPQGLVTVLDDLREHYFNPVVYVTETGFGAIGERPDGTGRIRDVERIGFLQEHLAAIARSLRRGARVKGLFVWTLLDCFEWNLGYTPQFGLVHVDRITLRRHRKDSYHWLRSLIAESGRLTAANADAAGAPGQ